MKATLTTETPIPPKVLFLELSELEARTLYWGLNASAARDWFEEIGTNDGDEAAKLAFNIERAVREAFEAEGVEIDLS